MPQEFDYCERCAARKSIYTETYKSKNVCRKCMKEMDRLPAWVAGRDIEYRDMLRKHMLGVKGATLINA